MFIYSLTFGAEAIGPDAEAPEALASKTEYLAREHLIPRIRQSEQFHRHVFSRLMTEESGVFTWNAQFHGENLPAWRRFQATALPDILAEMQKRSGEVRLFFFESLLEGLEEG